MKLNIRSRTCSAGGPMPLPGSMPTQSSVSPRSCSSSSESASEGRWGSFDIRAPIAER